MSWQEELRALDEELATGRLSADEYRVRRDHVLSSAAGTPSSAPAPPPVTTQSEQTQTIQPVSPPQGQPVPPVQGENPDKTQVVNVGEVERTQVVGGWQTDRPHQSGEAERTQVVPGVPPQHQQYPGGGYPQQQQQNPWGQPPPPQQQPDEMSPPWQGAEFPPLAVSGSPDWVRQGPEVFDDSASSGGKRGLIIGLVVLVLAGLGVGAYFMFSGKDEEQPPVAQQTSQQPQKPTTTTKPRPTDPNVALFEDMPNPPASQQKDGKVADVAELVSLKLISQAEADLLTTAGVTKAPWKSAVRKAPEEGPTADALQAIVIPTKSPADAQKLLTDLRTAQEGAGMIFIPEPLPNMPPSVVFEKLVVAEQAIYRGLYVSGSNVVRINAVQTPFENEASLSGSYRNHTEAMLRAFPAE
ncbi:flagellar basal body-associated FliL family protein [Actinokineospora iranica]|uniref:Flagellar basal body-associated protein FliL n=1 Tax=Actinokineospora iranica TaxID=1271860 RepID=A0A1G6PCW5_9PSEU|nr:hypothetical protein [Actinokineospora iranica]SDC78003.1 hypothetical protein SAMN05216174_104237 [Actinokineospora iranica]